MKTIYHGVRRTPSSSIYRLGLALFDLEQPKKCLIHGDSWMFAPEAKYEHRGDVQDVVFPCGYTAAADGDTINLYYGAPIQVSRWLTAASVRCSLGSMRMAIRSTQTTGVMSESAIEVKIRFPFCGYNS
jgi:beta-1,4-mannooligosaccharide phosphorylase